MANVAHFLSASALYSRLRKSSRKLAGTHDGAVAHSSRGVPRHVRLDDMPYDVLLELFYHLGVNGVLAMAQVCTTRLFPPLTATHP